MKFNTLSFSVLGLLLGAAMVQATPVTVTLKAVGISDGANYVLPYTLMVNGATISADCYDFFDQIVVGQTWQANILNLSQAATSGMFSGKPGALHGYETIAVLSDETATTAQNQIDLQHAIWNVFDPGHFAVTPGVAAYNTDAAALLPTFDFSDEVFIEGVKGTSVQGFVADAPEPVSLGLMGAGLLGVWFIKRRKKAEVA